VRSLAVMLVAVSASACADRGGHRAEQSTGDHPSSPSTTAARPALVRIDPANTYDYALNLSSKLSMGTASGEVDVALKATLSVTPLSGAIELPAGTQPLFLALKDVKLSSTHTDPASFDDLSRELQAGFVVELLSGDVTRVSMARASAFAANLARSVAAQLALGPLPSAEQKVWEAPGADASGSYVTELSRGEAPDSVRIRKLRYAARALGQLPGSNEQLSLTPQVLESAGEARVVTGELQSISYTEALGTPLLSSGNARADTKISLMLANRRPLASAGRSYAAARAGMVDLSDSNALRDSTIQADAFDRSKIGDFTFASATAKLEQLSSGPALILTARDAERETTKSRQAREQRLAEFNRTFTALTAIVRADESTIAACASGIRANAKRANFLIDALVAAATEPAQALLVALAQDLTVAEGTRQRALSSVLRVQTPTTATVTALLSWLDQPERRTFAIYGLGTQARHLREQGQNELAKRAAQPLGALLRSTTGAGERVHLLRGIANSGDPALLPAVRPLLADADESVRGAAIEALRLMEAPEVDEIVARSLRSEQSYEVLRAAVGTAQMRAPGALLSAALSDAARGSQDSQTRYRATQVLARWLTQRPELRGVLAELAAKDENQNVRDVAARALKPS
jgi:hypothetical protein